MTTQSPLVNSNSAAKFYSDAQFTTHQYAQSQIGVGDLAASGAATGNGNYVLFTAPANGVIFGATFTVLGAGTTAGSTLQCRLISANNGANVSQNVALGNVVTVGVNVAGNVYSTGPFTYNVYANGAASSSNVANAGGFAVNVGDVLFTTFSGNTGLLGAVVEYAVSPSAFIYQ